MRSPLHDYKDWIQEKADETANETFGKDFYDLPEIQQDVAYFMACEAYKDYYADMIDKLYDQEKERRMGL